MSSQVSTGTCNTARSIGSRNFVGAVPFRRHASSTTAPTNRRTAERSTISTLHLPGTHLPQRLLKAYPSHPTPRASDSRRKVGRIDFAQAKPNRTWGKAMKRTHVIRRIALAAAALPLLLFAACGGSDDAETPEPTVTATASATPATTTATPDADQPITVSAPASSPSGGDVSIAIPKDALPQGVSPSDVKIEDITQDELAVTIEDADVISAYRLLPDGLVLSEPATVTLHVPAERLSGGLMLVHLTDEGLSPIDDLTVTIDDAGKIATIEATITHFSDLTALQTNFFDIGLLIFDNVYKVGESFEVTILVSSTKRGWGYREDAEGITMVKVQEPAQLEGFWTGKSPALTPNLVEDRPSFSPLESGYSNTQVFTCEEEISGVSLTYRGSLYYALETQFVKDDGRRDSIPVPGGWTEIQILEQEPIECVLVPPIVAKLDAPITVFSIDVEPDAGYSFVWSGPNCGSVTGTSFREMIWEHGDEDCEHAGETHDDVTISVLVVAKDGREWRCNYPGAASGTGEPCEEQK